MDLWFSDYHADQIKMSVKVKNQLFGEQTEFQRIDVFDSDELGRFLSSDGKIVFSEKDGFIYDEMIVHVPMAVHPKVKNVLVLGGGDGGVLRMLEKYDGIECIDVTEPDQRFVEVCREFFPDTAASLDDPRVRFYHIDGLKFLRTKQGEYDLIINDAIDPLGHKAGLFTREFYGNCYRALKEDGIMVYQHGSPFYEGDEESCRLMHNKASHSFPISRVYQAHIPTCSSGYWLFGFASKKYHPLRDFDRARWEAYGIETDYYTPHLHQGAFMLPKYVEDMLREEEGRKERMNL
ncbi:MAG: polyamine aminopropyltransferase [Lachnospiraceae bacterium]|nr:polyamine aminopropyltransferase [Lachnospiraceae bacterium]